MRHFRHIIGTCLLAAGVTPVTALGQAADQTPTKPPTDTAPADISPSITTRERDGQVIQPEQAGVNTVDSALRPARPGVDPLSPEVKDRVRIFEQYRNEYLKQQDEIRKRLQGTTDLDREKIRERFKELRERWREQSVATREELRDRRKELLDRLPSHREVLEKLREDSRQNLRERRERRGIDN